MPVRTESFLMIGNHPSKTLGETVLWPEFKMESFEMPNHTIQRMRASRLRQLQSARPWRLARTSDGYR